MTPNRTSSGGRFLAGRRGERFLLSGQAVSYASSPPEARRPNFTRDINPGARRRERSTSGLEQSSSPQLEQGLGYKRGRLCLVSVPCRFHSDRFPMGKVRARFVRQDPNLSDSSVIAACFLTAGRRFDPNTQMAGSFAVSTAPSFLTALAWTDVSTHLALCSLR